VANPPPPYNELTGISRTVMKDNAQETVSNYSGNARPAEMTVNINTNEIYIGNAAGALTKVLQVTGANTYLGNIRQVSNTTGLRQLWFDPATGEVVYYVP
jgi:hypothetical protein